MAKKKSTRYPGVSYAEVKRKDGKSGTEKAFYVAFRKNGKRYFELAGYQSINAMTAARANTYRTDRITGKIPDRGSDTPTERTLSDIWGKYRLKLTKSNKTDITNFKHLKALHNRVPHELTRKDIESLYRPDLSTQTNVHILKLLSRIINFGVDYDMCQPLPFRIKYPKLNNTKTETMTQEEISRLLDCLEDEHDWVVVGVIKLAMYTGMRKGEILGLKWDDVDLERGFISIRNPKGGVDQTIPINSLAKEVLESIPKTKYEYIFYGRNGNKRHDIKRGIERLRKNGAFPKDFRPLHGLRHVFATEIASSGKVDLYTLQKLLTHKSHTTTQRYAHLHDEALKKGSSVVEDIFKKR